MDMITGTLKTLGPSTTALQAISVTTYTYIEIGNRVVKKIRVFEGLNGPLQEGLQRPDPVTLYIKNGILCGVRLPDGRTFASEMVSTIYLYAAIASAAILGLITLPLLGMGLFFFYFGWLLWKVLEAKNATGTIPDAVYI